MYMKSEFNIRKTETENLILSPLITLLRKIADDYHVSQLRISELMALSPDFPINS